MRSDWSGTVVRFRAPRALRDPAPPARSPWRGFGGAGGPPRTERRISMSKSAKKQMSKKDRKRLEQLFRMIGSPNAGEAENARRLILEMLARYRKTWNDLTDLMRGDTNADTWGAAFDDDRSAEQHAGDAVDAGLPEAAVKEPPNVLEWVHFILEEYIDMKPREYIAAALWVLHTHLFDRFTISQLLSHRATSRATRCRLVAAKRGHVHRRIVRI